VCNGWKRILDDETFYRQLVYVRWRLQVQEEEHQKTKANTKTKSRKKKASSDDDEEDEEDEDEEQKAVRKRKRGQALRKLRKEENLFPFQDYTFERLRLEKRHEFMMENSDKDKLYGLEDLMDDEFPEDFLILGSEAYTLDSISQQDRHDTV